MVDSHDTDNIISWGPDGTSFVVWKTAEFARDILPEHFKHNNFSSFVRQLNTYGFRKIDPDRWEFANECFVRGHRELLNEIHRRKPTAGTEPRPAPREAGTLSAVELGAYGGLKVEVEQLKRDKKLLVEEVVRLRQVQVNSESLLLNVQQRLALTETRQQQMIAFLAKAMQHPAILAQFPGSNPTIQRIDDGRRRKKRRGRGGLGTGAPAGGESESDTSETEGASPYGTAARPSGGDHRMVVHQGAVAGAPAVPGAEASLGELAQAFMQLLNPPPGPGPAPAPMPAVPAPFTAPGGWAPVETGAMDVQGPDSVPVIKSVPLAQTVPGSVGIPGIGTSGPPGPAFKDLAPGDALPAKQAVGPFTDFIPVETSAPTITELDAHPLTELDGFSLDDLDFGGIGDLDKDLLGSSSVAEPATLWTNRPSLNAPSALTVESSPADLAERSPPSFLMPDFGDLTPIVHEPPPLGGHGAH